ncbi:hypothetical protein QQS21_000749 [Conoideocrella luteorostrata]|uniref:FAD/NAD(P)-binding domain-containing protein n=1 Tax=Conoideocrella luteorostrata TaxID=1105319 RepID=A0AAJ0CZA2_9HYPO|nr:hypothetical protein QQS21_000749 [Conoideocrella luteorostrata]
MPQRIVIVGAGFAGLYSALSARRLISQNGKDAEIEVVVIAPNQSLTIRPRLYEASPATLAAPLGDLFMATGVKFVTGTVRNIRTSTRKVNFTDAAGEESDMAYDRLILAAGSHLKMPDVPGLKEHAFNVDQLQAATELDQHLHDLVSLPRNTARNTVVVCGGGFTGIEVAAELPARLRSILGEKEEIRVVVVERNLDIGPALGPGPRPIIKQAFEDYGIETKLGVEVSQVDAKGATTSTGERIEASTVIWTVGMVATELTTQIHGDKDQLGRLIVDANLQVPHTPSVFATGDAARAVADDDGHAAMMSCQHALVLGRSSGHNAAADLLQLPKRPYAQPYYGTCLDLGPAAAVLTEGWDRKVLQIGGQAKAVKKFINTMLIYPPPANAVEAYKAADPDYKMPDLDPSLFQYDVQA